MGLIDELNNDEDEDDFPSGNWSFFGFKTRIDDTAQFEVLVEAYSETWFRRNK